MQLQIVEDLFGNRNANPGTKRSAYEVLMVGGLSLSLISVVEIPIVLGLGRGIRDVVGILHNQCLDKEASYLLSPWYPV